MIGIVNGSVRSVGCNINFRRNEEEFPGCGSMLDDRFAPFVDVVDGCWVIEAEGEEECAGIVK
jgi:hypothetical protein